MKYINGFCNLLRSFSKMVKKISFETVARLLVFILNLNRKIKKFYIPFLVILRTWLLTIITIIIALVLINSKAMNVSEIKDVLLGIVGSTITILTIAFSLSIIAIQRASESWSPAILNIYRNDKKIYIAFLFFSFIIVGSFILSTIIFSAITNQYILILSFVFFTSVLDILRWYYDYVCKLLNPITSISIARGEAEKIINKYAKYAKLFASSSKLFDKQKKRESYYESLYYLSVTNHANPINYWVDILAEMAIKSITLGETKIAESSLRAIFEVAQCYLTIRKNNIVITPSHTVPLATENDASKVMDYIYDALRRVNQNAVVKQDELSAIEVTKTYTSIATVTTIVVFEDIYYKYEAPLMWSPLCFLIESIKYAQQNGIDEVVFRSTEITLNTLTSLSKDLIIDNIYILIFEWFKDVAIYFLCKNKAELANIIIARMMQIVFHMLNIKYQKLYISLSHLLDQLRSLVHITITMSGNINVNNFIGSPLRSAYSTTSITSIGYFLQHAASLIKIDDKESDVNIRDPYLEFISISEEIHQHFRNLADNIEFADNILLSEMIATIKHIAKLFIYIITPLDDHAQEMRLVNELKWQLAFLWAVFHNKKEISFRYIKEACDVYAYVGIKFSCLTWFAHEVLVSCVSNILSIIDSYAKAQDHVPEDKITDLLIYIWLMRIAAETQQLSSVVEEIDKKLSKFIDENKYTDYLSAFEQKKMLLYKRLNREMSIIHRDSAEDILLDLINYKNSKT